MAWRQRKRSPRKATAVGASCSTRMNLKENLRRDYGVKMPPSDSRNSASSSSIRSSSVGAVRPATGLLACVGSAVDAEDVDGVNDSRRVDLRFDRLSLKRNMVTSSRMDVLKAIDMPQQFTGL